MLGGYLFKPPIKIKYHLISLIFLVKSYFTNERVGN